jgi:hypothetical protein
MATKGVLVWQGNAGGTKRNKGYSTVADVSSFTALATFFGAIDQYSYCNRSQRSFTEAILYNEAIPGTTANVDRVGLIYFRDGDTGQVRKISIPAIKTIYTDVEESGERVKDSVVTAVVDALSTATGKTLFPLYGVVVQK